MKKNRIFESFVALAVAVSTLAGCGSSVAAPGSSQEDKTAETSSLKADEAQTQSDGKYSIVCTTFPQYDWVCEIIGDGALKDKFDVTYLMDNGVDLHNYQPSAEDIVKIGDADLFIYVGGESDGWVADALTNASNKNIASVNMVEAIGDGIREEETVEGMQAEAEESGDGASEEAPEYDEHVWLSLRNAETIVGAIAEQMKTIDAEDADAIQTNADAYNKELAALDAQFTDAVKNASVKAILFGDRFPFRYFADDYGLTYYAAFVGCSAESEASFETITFLAQKVDELNLPAVLTIENSDQKIAKTIVSNTKNKDQKILVMDSLQSVSAEDIKGGKTYLSTMTENLATLKTALGE